jgi:hypothetical protein
MDRTPEAWFIERVLLGSIGRPLRVVAAESLAEAPFLDDVLVVSMTTEFAGYLAEARRRGHQRLMLLHLGDEHGTDDRAFYTHADRVFRNYWFDPILADAKVAWVPNGYAVGVGPMAPEARLPASVRPIAGFFAGSLGARTLSHERLAAVEAVERAGLPFMLRPTPTSRDRLGSVAYAAHLGMSRFALVPGGNSPETIRLYDALEMGAIPILLRSRFVEAEGALANPPLLLLDDWSQLAQAYAPYDGSDAASLARLDELQARCGEWWRRFSLERRERVRKVVDQVLGD